ALVVAARVRALVVVPLEHESLFDVAPVAAESDTRQAPIVAGFVPVHEQARATLNDAGEHAIPGVAGEASAIAKVESLIDVAKVGVRKSALRLSGVAGDDVDDAVDGVRAPKRAAGAAHALDPLDVVEHDMLLI